jgi:hypothetical protein
MGDDYWSLTSVSGSGRIEALLEALLGLGSLLARSGGSRESLGPLG